MGILQELLRDIPVPKMAKVKVRFDDNHIEDLGIVLQEKFQRVDLKKAIQPGMEIAIAVGSRGLDRLVELTTETVLFLKSLGAKPFIVPSMGSHGGATAEGQRAVLEHLGVTEEAVGVKFAPPWKSSKLVNSKMDCLSILINTLQKRMELL